MGRGRKKRKGTELGTSGCGGRKERKENGSLRRSSVGALFAIGKGKHLRGAEVELLLAVRGYGVGGREYFRIRERF